MQQVLVTGANRGIGLEFVRQYLDRGEHVFAACREPAQARSLHAHAERAADRLTLLALDVTDYASIQSLSEALAEQVDGLDLLINNAGVYPRGDHLSQLSPDVLRRTFEVNTYGPILLASALLAQLRAVRGSKVINLSSEMGSIAHTQSGSSYSYRASKAALNMLTRVLAHEVRPFGIIAVAMNPGWVQTDMGGQHAPLPVEQSVRGMIEVIEGLTLEHTGRFLEWDGGELLW